MAKRYSNDRAINSVLSDAGLSQPAVNSWSHAGVVGKGVTLTYDFMSSAPSGAAAGGFRPFTAAQKAGARKAMDEISDVANVKFKYKAAGTAQIEFGTVSFGGSPNGYQAGQALNSWSIVGNNTFYTHSDVYLTNSHAAMLNMKEGGAGYATMLHELAHGMGLEHTFHGRRAPGGTDNEQYSVMSYTPHRVMDTSPASLMLYDIAAMQYLYGANMSTRKGSTNYKWDKNEAVMEAIWDAGGRDTINASNQSRRVIIDLGDGKFSSIGSNGHGGNAKNNIAIAYDAQIENAKGGRGHDTITGNEVRNILTGGLGNDKMKGLAGNDKLIGGKGHDKLYGGSGNDLFFDNQGNDRVFGGAGNDTFKASIGRDFFHGGPGSGDKIDYSSMKGALTIKLNVTSSQHISGQAGNDTLRQIENATGGKGDDTIFGSAGSVANTLNGGAGNDELYGLGGKDRLLGGSGNDTLEGGAGSDRLNGGSGADKFVVSLASDSSPGAGRDYIEGFSRSADKIDLQAMDAISGGGDDAFTFIAGAFSNVAGQLRVHASGSQTLVQGDTNGDGSADFEILVNVATLDASDFML